ncbi:Lar family restriction alleviation protein [Pseudomonas sp.]|uniref:Lar family restriction alleviation protein n=1 Tax=Pseudomonas sp. TaxID=306 RepID=UPI0026482224|nr:Lar family restriction alleviation protein [Pseudomonas sp.]MDN5518568.1 Lar family restriction alleviation protein [Pseudomonas sp.]MDN5531398.1 Lar family restriction alleviation protein [Pseudomonas sp.]
MVSELLTCPFCGEKPQITKHHREDIYSFMHRCQVLGPISWGFREDQQAHIEKWNARAQPAPQLHPEPIAWMVGTAIWWTKEEAERDAAATGLPIVGLGPMTGAAEVERLRGENEQLREVIKHSDSNIQRQSLRISNQRAQLAERDALLREALEFIDDGVGRSDAEWRLIKKLRAALSPDGAASASDEPYQGMPGTSFQRLNALANQGE